MITKQTARKTRVASLAFALEDVNATLAIWDRDETADSRYLQKLRDERDVIVAELQRRVK
jgi:hypothetical protein